MSSVKVDFTKLDALIFGMPQKAQELVNEAGAMGLRFAQAVVPVRTGALRASGKSEPAEGRSVPTCIISFGNDDVIYAYFVECGTRKMAARPFLTPGAEQARAELVQRLREMFA